MNNISEQLDDSNLVAIVGMSCRLPGARNLNEFWQNLRNGVEAISFFTDEELKAEGVSSIELEDSHYIKAASYLTDVDYFDADFFNFTPREAEITDPQHRLFLECVWTALEHAGYNCENDTRAVGVYAGTSLSSYLLFNLFPNSSLLRSVGPLQLILGNDKDYLATRVSYKLNLHGPSISVQSACSTSLVAVHLACQGLLNHECDVAIAGGVRVSVPVKTGYFYQEGSIYSPDGHCRAFDADAQGTIFGSGVGVVVLKRLADALADGDTIHSVILGSAINNDGSTKVGYSAPSVEGQAKVVAEALAVADVAPDTISYIEAHGTGTPLGDPIEISALSQVFRATTQARGFCAIGSLKSNVGHLEVAAGVASLIKSALMLEHQTLVPSINFQCANAALDLDKSPFYVNTQLANWPSDVFPRRAGVSSFGIGGTNAHVVLEEPPTPAPSEPSRPWQLLMLSAKSDLALERATQNLAIHLKQHPKLNLSDVAYTYQVGRSSFNYRRFVLCQSQDEAITVLETLAPQSIFCYHHIEQCKPSVLFAFPGQGSQYLNMGRELYESEPTFRKHLNYCAQLFSLHLNIDLLQTIYPSIEQQGEATERLRQTIITQPALFSVEYALAQTWMSWGVTPSVVIGHSIGEYVAACLAGVFNLEDAITLVAKRSQLMQTLPLGQMLSVSLSEDELQPLLGNQLSLAAVNGCSLCVVSGSPEAISELQTYLDQQCVHHKLLHTSHAFHSTATESLLEPFARCFRNIELKSPQIPYISSVTGTWIDAAEITKANYWVQQLHQTVRFASGMQQILELEGTIFLEVGPGTTLSTLARKVLDRSTDRAIINSLPHPQDQRSSAACLMVALGQLWLRGVRINWTEFYAHERRRRLPLPTYPFDTQRYWIDPPKTSAYDDGNNLPLKLVTACDRVKGEKLSVHTQSTKPLLEQALCTPTEIAVACIWENVLGITPVNREDNFFDLGGHSLAATQLIAQLQEQFCIELPQQIFFRCPTIAQLASAIDSILASTSENGITNSVAYAKSLELVDLSAEAVLNSNIRVTEELVESSKVMDRVLLTGATGYLGAFLLLELLLQTDAKVYCLVRSHSIEEGASRICDNLKSYGLWQPSFADRIVPVLGNLAQPRLGLSKGDYETLAIQIDAIYHNGARVNFTEPYNSFKSNNVLSTQEVLQLAVTSKVKPVHFTSSIAIFESTYYSNTTGISEQYNLDLIHGLFRGYAQSKWVAEKLIMIANTRGLPVSIYRPGNVAGHSQTGMCNSNDFIWRMMKGCIQLGIAPDIDTAIDITPVDYVSKALVYLSRQPNNSGQTFHLVNPHSITWKEITRWIQALGYPLTLLPYDIWQKQLVKSIHKSQENALYPLASLFFGTTGLSDEERAQLLHNPKLDCQLTAKALSGSGISFPNVNVEVFDRYIAHFIRTSFLNAPPLSKDLTLAH